MAEKKKWLGSQTKCDICRRNLKDFTHFYDARMIMTGQWALMCEKCFQDHTNGRLGTGLGQQYDSLTREKTAG